MNILKGSIYLAESTLLHKDTKKSDRIPLVITYIYINQFLQHAGNICCKQVKTTTTFKSQQANKTWKIFHNTNCKTEYAIYLLECKSSQTLFLT